METFRRLLRLDGDPTGAVQAITQATRTAQQMGADMVRVTESINTRARGKATLIQRRVQNLSQSRDGFRGISRAGAEAVAQSEQRLTQLRQQQISQARSLRSAEAALNTERANAAREEDRWRQRVAVSQNRATRLRRTEATRTETLTQRKRAQAGVDREWLDNEQAINRANTEWERLETRRQALSRTSLDYKKRNTEILRQEKVLELEIDQRAQSRVAIEQRQVLLENEYTQALDRQQKRTLVLEHAQRQLDAARARQRTGTRAGAVSIDTHEAQVREARNKLKATTDQLKAAERDLREGRTQLNQTDQKVEATEKQIYTQSLKLEETQKRSISVRYQLGEGMQHFGTVAKEAANKATDRFVQFGERFGSIYVRLQGARIGFAAVGQGLTMFRQQAAGFLQPRIEQVAAFDEKLTETVDVVHNVLGVNQSIRDEALNVGRDTKYSRQDALDVTNQLLRAGLDVQTVEGHTRDEMASLGQVAKGFQDNADGATRAVTDLSAATGAELTTSVQTVTVRMQAYKDSHLTAAQAIDTAGRSVNAANQTLSQYNEAMKVAVPVAARLGVSYEDTAKAVTSLARAGVTAGPAGTALKYLMENAVPKSGVALEQMKNLGLATFNQVKATDMLTRAHVRFVPGYQGVMQGLYNLAGGHGKLADASTKAQATFQKWLQTNHLVQSSFFDSEGHFKGITDQVRQLWAAMKDMPQDQQMQALRDIFGLKAGSSSGEIFLQQLTDAMKSADAEGTNMVDVFHDVDGSMDSMKSPAEIAQDKMNTLSGRIEYLSGSWSTFVQESLEAAQGPLKTVISILGEWVDKASNMVRANHELAQMISYVAIGGTAFSALAGGLLIVASAWPYVIAGIGGFLSARLPLTAALTIMLATVMAVAHGVMDPTSGLHTAVANFAQFLLGQGQRAIEVFTSFLQNVLLPVSNAIANRFVQYIIPTLQHFIRALLVAAPSAVAALGKILPAITGPVGFIFGLLARVGDAISGLIVWLGHMAPAFASTFGQVSSRIAPITGFIQDTLNDLVSFLVGPVLGRFKTIVTWILTNRPRASRLFVAEFNKIRPILDRVGAGFKNIIAFAEQVGGVLLHLGGAPLLAVIAGFGTFAMAVRARNFFLDMAIVKSTISMGRWAIDIVRRTSKAAAGWVVYIRKILFGFGVESDGLILSTGKWVLWAGRAVGRQLLVANRAILNAGKTARAWLVMSYALNGSIRRTILSLLALGAGFVGAGLKAGLLALAAGGLQLITLPLTAGIWLMDAAMTALDRIVGLLDLEFLPLILVIGAVIVAIGLLYWAWQSNFRGIQDIAKTVGDRIVSIWAGVVDFFKKAFQWLQDSWRQLTGEAATYGEGTADRFGNAIKDRAEGWGDEVAPSFNGLQDLMKALGLNAGPLGEVAGYNYGAGISNGIRQTRDTIYRQLDEINAALGRTHDKLGRMIPGMRDEYSDLIHQRAGAKASLKYRTAPVAPLTTPGGSTPDSKSPGYTGTGGNPFGPDPKSGAGGGGRNRKSAAEKAADLIKNTADRISKGITAFRQLSGMQIPSNVAAKAREFAQAAAEVVMEIQKVSLRFQSKDDSLLDHVTKFADAASKSMDLISKGVDRFKALDTFKAPLLSQIVRFVEVVRQTVVLFAQARSHFTLEGLVFVGEFADTAGKVVDLIGKGVDSFRKLDGFVAPRQNRLRRFADAIQRTMLLIAPLALSWSPQALEASSEFADRAGKVVDSLSKGVDFFQKLGKDETDYRDLAGRTQELENAVQQTMNTLGPMTAKWKGFTGTARDFADRSGKVADSLMKSIDFLDKLASSKTPYRLLRSRVTELSNASLQMMNTFGPLTGRWNKTFADQTSLFADAAGKVADSLMKAQDFLDKLNSSKTPFRRLNLRVDELRNRTRHMADSFQSVAPDWKQTAEATTLFADRSRKIAESLGKAQDFFDKLLTSKTNFSALGRRVVQLVSAERSMAEQMKLAVPADYTDTTSTFADRAGKIAETLTKALDFFNALRTSKRPPDPAKAYQLRGALARTLRGYQEALARAGQGVAGLDEEAIALKGQLADAQAKIVRTLSRTFDLMKRLAEYQEPKKANAGLLLSRVVQFLRDSLVEFSTYQQEFRRELDRDGAVLAENIGKAIGGLSRAFDLFTKLEGYTGVQESSIGRFIGDLRTTVRLLRDGLLGTVAPEVLDLAEAFGTKLRPRMDTLGKALDLFLKMQISTDKDGKTSGFTGVSDERIQSFITSLVLLIVRLRDGLLNTIAPEILDLAQAFGEKVGPRMDVLGKTLDIFLKINGDGKEGSGLKHVDPDRIGELVGSLYILLVHWKHLIQGGEFQDRDFGTRSQAFAAIVAVVVDSINKVLDLVGRINDPQSKLGDIGRRIAQAVSGLGALMSLVTPRMNQVQAGIHAGLAGATEEVVRGSNYKQEGTLTWAWAFGILQNMVDRLEGKNGRKVQIRVGFRTLMTDAGAIVDDGAAGLLTSWQTRMTGMVQRAQDAVAGIVRALAAIPTNVSINYGTGSLPPGRAPAGAPPPPSGGGGPNNPARYGASQVSNHNYNIRALRIEKTTDLPKQLQRERAFGADPA